MTDEGKRTHLGSTVVTPSTMSEQGKRPCPPYAKDWAVAMAATVSSESATETVCIEKNECERLRKTGIRMCGCVLRPTYESV